MNKKLPSFIALGVFCMLSIAGLNAQLISYESFDYTPGTLLTNGSTGLNGGTGWNTPWFRDYSGGNPRFITSGIASVGNNAFGSNTASPLPTAGNTFQSPVNNERGVREWASVGSADAFNVAATDPADEVFFSFLANTGDSAAAFLSFRLYGNSTTDSVPITLQVGGTGQFRLFADGANSVASDFGAISASTDYFIVLRLSSAENTRETRMQAAFYETASNVPASIGAVTWDLDGTYTFAQDESLNAVWGSSSGPSSPVLMDEIRVGNDWNSVAVIPEPSMFSLIGGLAAFALLIYKRRRA